MAILVLRIDMTNVDPTERDPHEVAYSLFDDDDDAPEGNLVNAEWEQG